MEGLWGFLGVIVTTLGANALQYLKTRAAQRGDKNEIKEAIDKIDQRLSIAEEKQSKTECEEKIKKRLSDNIIQKAFSIISANTESINGSLKAILNATEQKITKFAISHRDSLYRKEGKDKWEEYLKLKASAIKDQIKHLANDIYPEKKEVNGEMMDYDQFIYHTTEIQTEISVMIQRLVENGMNDDQYIDLFVNFIEKLFKQQIKGWREWVRL